MNRFTVITLMLSLILFITGCTTTSSKDRGSLSDAMEKARDDYEGERDVPDDDEYYAPKNNRNDRDRDNTYSDSGDSYRPSEPLDTIVLFRGGQGYVNGPYFHSGFDSEILLGFSDRWLEIYALAGLKTFTTRGDHEVFDSIKEDSFMLHAGIESRFYPFSSFSFLSPYALGRIGGFYHFYSYENPLTSGSDTIYSDIVGGAFFGVGLGFDLLHTDTLRLGIQLSPEAYVFGEGTTQGFNNDYFDAQGTVKWSVDGGIRF